VGGGSKTFSSPNLPDKKGGGKKNSERRTKKGGRGGRVGGGGGMHVKIQFSISGGG